MVEAVGGQINASAAMNALLNELSGARGTRRSAPPVETGATEPSAEVRGKSELTEEERREVENLKRRDGEVRRHEAAHKAAAGQHAAGGPTFEYSTGPDGRRYATGGEVQIDTSEVPGDPQATIDKMQLIRRAANAPAEPSSQDRRVAAQAAATEAQARAELARSRNENGDGESSVTAHSNFGLVEAVTFSNRANTDALSPRGGVRFDAVSAQIIQPGRFIDVTA